MNLDEIDLLIIKLTLQQKKLTSTKLAQIIYSSKDVYELRKKDVLIRKRAKKLLNYGILERKIINDISYWNIGKAVFVDVPIYINKKKIKFLGVVIKINGSYLIHGINQ